VPCYVAIELGAPEIDPGLRHVRESTPRMPVPEASVNEKNRSVARQDDVWFAGQIASVEPKPVAQPMERTPDSQFGRGASRPDPRHVGPSLRVNLVIPRETGHSKSCRNYCSGCAEIASPFIKYSPEIEPRGRAAALT